MIPMLGERSGGRQGESAMKGERRKEKGMKGVKKKVTDIVLISIVCLVFLVGHLILTNFLPGHA